MRCHRTALAIMALAGALATGAIWPAAAAPATAASATAFSRTVVVARNKPAIIASEKLRIALIHVEDSRCPVNARCIWAGHAAVTLSVMQAGKPENVVVGTPAPAGMQLPHDADFGPYHFSLIALTPDNPGGDAQGATRYRATVQVTKPAR